jgi:hypothetical protein
MRKGRAAHTRLIELTGGNSIFVLKTGRVMGWLAQSRLEVMKMAGPCHFPVANATDLTFSPNNQMVSVSSKHGKRSRKRERETGCFFYVSVTHRSEQFACYDRVSTRKKTDSESS